jgi:hypothetical protein
MRYLVDATAIVSSAGAKTASLHFEYDASDKGLTLPGSEVWKVAQQRLLDGTEVEVMFREVHRKTLNYTKDA